MKAAVVRAFGALPRYEEFPEPVPGRGEVVVHVRAAGLHPVVRALAAGTHYGSGDGLPVIAGVDGVGVLEDGTRVWFGNTRAPFGTFAERSVVPAGMCLPLPDVVPDEVAAAIMNPGLAAWLALSWRAALVPGERVLVLGATGVSGQLAVAIARQMGATSVIAAGRDEQVLAALRERGAAETTIRLDRPPELITAEVAAAAGESGIDVIIDYVWGSPTEAVLAALARTGLTHTAHRVRLIEVGQSAGSTITLPAALLRGSGVEIYGSGAGTIPIDEMVKALPPFLDSVAAGTLRIEAEPIPLSDVQAAWTRDTTSGRRIVLQP